MLSYRIFTFHFKMWRKMDTDISQTVIHEIYLIGVWSHTYRPVASIMKGGIWALENWRISAGCCRSICVWPEIKPAWAELISLGAAWVTWAATEALLTRYRLGEDEANSRTSIVVQSLSSAPQKKNASFEHATENTTAFGATPKRALSFADVSETWFEPRTRRLK